MQHAGDASARPPRVNGCCFPSKKSCRTFNRFLTGWSGYFRYGNSAQFFDKISLYSLSRLAKFVANRCSPEGAPTATAASKHSASLNDASQTSSTAPYSPTLTPSRPPSLDRGARDASAGDATRRPGRPIPGRSSRVALGNPQPERLDDLVDLPRRHPSNVAFCTTRTRACSLRRRGSRNEAK